MRRSRERLTPLPRAARSNAETPPAPQPIFDILTRGKTIVKSIYQLPGGSRGPGPGTRNEAAAASAVRALQKRCPFQGC